MVQYSILKRSSLFVQLLVLL
uniref:Uncharacterized protein n=1 Tax=Arundo donax TaxID=35708 RepID=A0A0A9H4Y3_ARUDO